MNELIIPCIHLIINNDISKDDLDAIEIMRNHWCSYLGQDIAGRAAALIIISRLLGILEMALVPTCSGGKDPGLLLSRMSKLVSSAKI